MKGRIKEKKKKNNKMNSFFKGLIVAGLVILMFTSYVISVKYGAADEGFIRSQNACTKEKVNKELKKGRELKNSDVAEFAKDCEEEEVLDLALTMWNTSMGHALERVVNDEVLLKRDACTKDRVGDRLSNGELVVNKSGINGMKECNEEEEYNEEDEYKEESVKSLIGGWWGRGW